MAGKIQPAWLKCSYIEKKLVRWLQIQRRIRHNYSACTVRILCVQIRTWRGAWFLDQRVIIEIWPPLNVTAPEIIP